MLKLNKFKTMIKTRKGKGVILLISVLVSIIIVIISRTIFIPNYQLENIQINKEVSLNSYLVAQRLSEGLKYKTVSYKDSKKFDYNEFRKFHDYLKTAFPEVNQKLKVETVNNYSLLYTWDGTQSSLNPIILTAHMDVVDVDKETIEMWRYAPFSGEIAEGKIWGRGARDNKGQMMAILEAVEFLLKEGMQPQRTIILAFGHDEEVLGINGAKKIAELLKTRNITPECVIDEGGAVLENVIPGIKKKVAVIATAEKGYLTIELSVNGDSSHSANPPKETSIGVLCNAIAKLEKEKFQTTLKEAEPMFTYAASEMKFPYNMIFRNLWLTSSIVEKIMLGNNDSAAMLRTTMAPTIIEGGFQDNVIPGTTRATVNLRLLPQDTIESTIQKIIKIIDDPRVQIKKVGYCNNAPAPSSIDTDSFKTLTIAIKQTFPEVVCVPYFLTGGTDTKHYADLTTNLYRFTPSIKEKDEIGHGINERIPVENYMQYIEFYINLILDF